MTWVSVNIVMHIKQPFLCDNGDPAIVCINHVIREPEAQSFRHQSQLYSSHIAKSPEIFRYTDNASPPHTITQVPLGEGTGDFLSTHDDGTSYHGEFQIALVNTSQQVDETSRLSTRTVSIDSLSDSGSEVDHKQIRRANVISRLKRKMSESSAQCKPSKTRKFQNADTANSQNNTFVGGQSMVNELFSENISDSLMDGLIQVQDFGTVVDAPVFSQLKEQINLNPKQQLSPMLDVQQLPSPLTPGSDTSEQLDLSSISEFGVLTVDINDVAVVPASILTPDASPNYKNSGPQLTAALLSALEETSFFADMKSKAIKIEDTEEKMNLPLIDASILENVLCDMNEPLLFKPVVEDSIQDETITPIVNEECKEEATFFGISECNVASMVASMSESLLDLLPTDEYDSSYSDDFDAMTTLSVSTEDSDLPEGHDELLHELHQLNQLAANSSPSYGKSISINIVVNLIYEVLMIIILFLGDSDLADALFDSTL